MESSRISFQVRATGSDLLLTVKLNQKIITSLEPGPDFQPVTIEFGDIDDGSYMLELEMSGKTTDHTKLDESGNIIQDRVIEINGMALDGIDLDYIFVEHSQYHHDRNGTREWTHGPFYGVMGCNGVVKFAFTTPIYMWLLEHM